MPASWVYNESKRTGEDIHHQSSKFRPICVSAMWRPSYSAHLSFTQSPIVIMCFTDGYAAQVDKKQSAFFGGQAHSYWSEYWVFFQSFLWKVKLKEPFKVTYLYLQFDNCLLCSSKQALQDLRYMVDCNPDIGEHPFCFRIDPWTWWVNNNWCGIYNLILFNCSNTHII